MAHVAMTPTSWTRPLLKWPEVFFLPLLIGLQLVLTVAVLFAPVVVGQRLPSPSVTWTVVVVNGLAELFVLGWSLLKWTALAKYSRWIVACDADAVTVRTHKGRVHSMPWSQFRGYALTRSPKRVIKVLSEDGSLDFSVPFRGRHEIHETTTRLLRALDARIPVGGVRKGLDDPVLRTPRWVSWVLLIVSMPLLGMPLWALWLNGFSVTAGVVVELLSRSWGLIVPLVLIGPLVFAVAVSNLLEEARGKARDSKPPKGAGETVGVFPAVAGTVRTVRFLQAGLTVIVLCLVAPMFKAGAFVSLALVVVTVATVSALTGGALNAVRRRVLVTTTHLVVRQGKKEWVWPHGTYTVSIDRVTDRFNQRVRNVTVARGATRLRLAERWSDGDWLSRALDAVPKT